MFYRRATYMLAAAMALLPAVAGAAGAEAPRSDTGEHYCVRPDGRTYGRGDGVDWDNAFSGLPGPKSTLWGNGVGGIGARDTVYVAGGTYQRMWEPGAGGTGDRARLTIRRATKNDHGAEKGWQDVFDTQVKITGPAYIRVREKPFVTIDGVTENGIYCISESNRGVAVWKSAHATIAYVRVDGSVNRDSYRGMDLRDSSHVVVRHCWISNTPNDNLLMLGMDDAVIEHCRLGPRISPAPGKYRWHADLIEARRNSNITFRCNTVEWHADGIFLFEGNRNWRIHGNVFYSGTEKQTGKATRTHSSNSPNGPIHIHNNVFYRLYAGVSYGSNTHGDVRNNIFYECLHDGFGGATHDHNYFVNCGERVQEPHKIAGPDPFVDAAKLDFRLKPGSPAIDVGAPFERPHDVDRAGTKRPQGRGWDVGAYEFVAGGRNAGN